jgi:beta-glucosidase
MKNKAVFFTIMLAMALQTTQGQQETNDRSFIDSLMSEMTVEEKIGQLTLFTSDWTTTGPSLKDDYEKDVKEGRCGNIFNAHTVKYNRKLQEIAVNESRMGIPLLFGYDVIHGYKTAFPIPLGEACSWDLELIEKSARLAAEEGAAGGLNWTFNPMVDISYDPRWGRVAEGAGEDPYYGALVAKAKVRGHQQDNLASPKTLAACMKHFAAYGAPEAGRDYNTVNMSERRLREVYLPPFKAAVDEGVATVMTAFNELNGVPATANSFLFKDILREEWGYEGMVVTDYTAINELVPHGFARDEKHAGELSLIAGIDMDMQGAVFYNYLKESLEEGKVTLQQIDAAVKNVLKLKADLGLFDDPYRYLDEQREKETILSEEHMEHALDAAKKSLVLLKNEPPEGEKLLPLQNIENKTIALIGPLGDNKEDMTGTWWASADIESIVTVKEGLEKRYPDAEIITIEGADTEGEETSGFEEAIKAAELADVVIMAIGENKLQSGEAASRTEIDLPGKQKDLVKAIHKTGKPIISVVFAGRPLAINWMEEKIPAILYAWHPGTRAGDAVAEVLSGDYNPSAKLVTTFPRNTGQIPLYYNAKKTGRPFDADNKYTSKYLYTPNEPLYPFGYGLSYTDFEYSDIDISHQTLKPGEQLTATVTLTNTGDFAGKEVAQCYIRDLVGSVTRPVKELKGFEMVELQPGEAKEVTFTITPAMLKFYNQQMEYVAEEGAFKLFIGTSSENVREASFTYTE